MAPCLSTSNATRNQSQNHPNTKETETFFKILAGPLPKGNDWEGHIQCMNRFRPTNLPITERIQELFDQHVASMVQAGFDPNGVAYLGHQGKHGFFEDTILHDDTLWFNALLKNGANPNGICRLAAYSDWPFLRLAALQGRPGMVQSLIEKGAEDVQWPTISSDNPLDYARNIQAKAQLQKSLTLAVVNGSVEQIQHWLTQGATVDSQYYPGTTALEAAIDLDNLHIARFLVVEKQASLETIPYQNAPLIRAICRRNLDMVKLLVTEGHAKVEAPDDSYDDSPLICAAREGCLDIAQYLVRNCKANVEGNPRASMTPLMAAAKSGDLAMVQFLLLESGANINTMRGINRTALDWAYGTHQISPTSQTGAILALFYQKMGS